VPLVREPGPVQALEPERVLVPGLGLVPELGPVQALEPGQALGRVRHRQPPNCQPVPTP